MSAHKVQLLFHHNLHGHQNPRNWSYLWGKKKHIFMTAICVNLLNTSLFVTVKLFITFSKNSPIEEECRPVSNKMAAILVDMVTTKNMTGLNWIRGWKQKVIFVGNNDRSFLEWLQRWYHVFSVVYKIT